MAKRPNQRLKLLYLAKIMLRLTDDEHGLQVEQIINELAKYDIAAERKSIYSDLEALQLFGIDIEKKHIGPITHKNKRKAAQCPTHSKHRIRS